MTTDPTGGPASGMSKLDEFAKAALSNPGITSCVKTDGQGQSGIAATAKLCYQFAEAMLAESERRVEHSEGRWGMKWFPYDAMKYAQQPLPPERRYVVLQLCSIDEYHPTRMVVGYLKYAAGDPNSPYFVTPGVTSIKQSEHLRLDVDAWCDCLPEDFAPTRETERAKGGGA